MLENTGRSDAKVLNNLLNRERPLFNKILIYSNCITLYMEEIELSCDSLKSNIDEAFRHVNELDINFMYELYDLIVKCNSEIQPQLYQYVCEVWGLISSDKSLFPEYRISKIDYEDYVDKYGDVVDAILNSYVKIGLNHDWNREKYYKELWGCLLNNYLFDDEKLKVFALYYIVIDTRTPYFNVGHGIRMDSEEFQAIDQNIIEAYREFLFISALDLRQRTERASLVLNVFEKLQRRDERILLIARILNHYDVKIQKIQGALR